MDSFPTLALPPDSVTLRVREGGRPLAYTYREAVNFHGFSLLGGLALGFQALARALPLLDPEGPERRALHLQTAFPGPGARDAFELVTRMVSEHRYQVVPDCAPADAPESPSGRYFFRFGYGTRQVRLSLLPEWVDPEFIALARKSGRNAGEAARLEVLKIAMADRLMGQSPEALFRVQVGSITPAD